MGSGIPDGIIAPQSAATAVILAAFLLHGLQPGPQVFVSSSQMVYTIFASLILGIVIMCVIGYFAVKPLMKVMDYPESVISAFVMLFCFISVFSLRNNITDLWFLHASDYRLPIPHPDAQPPRKKKGEAGSSGNGKQGFIISYPPQRHIIKKGGT